MPTKIIPVFLATSIGFLFTIPTASAQQVTPATARQQTPSGVSDSDVAMMRKDLRDQKKQIVAANLPLTPDEAVKFWPIYEQYTAGTIKINDQRFGLIKEYAETYSTMTDEQAGGYIRRWIATDEDASKLRQTYIPQFEKVIPAKKVAMFFQIDRRLGLMMELQLASQLPLVSAGN
jgi:hypothetical protein